MGWAFWRRGGAEKSSATAGTGSGAEAAASGATAAAPQHGASPLPTAAAAPEALPVAPLQQASEAGGSQQQQQQQPGRKQAPAAPDCPAGDCAWELVQKKEYCKDAFSAFEGCFDAVEAGKGKEEDCMPLFDAFRDCMKKRLKVDEIIKEAMG